MPAVRFLISKHYTLFIFFIIFNGEIMSPCSYYIKKGLVYIIIAEPSNYQPSFYSKYMKANTCLLCNVYSVFFNKYMFLVRLASL